MKIFNKKLLLILLIILVIFSIIILKPDKKVILDSVQVVDNTNNKFAIQYQVNGKYEDIDKFLGKEDGYILNTTLSKCQNEDGFIIQDVISYDNTNKSLTINTDNTSYCYLFFDEEENLKNLCKENNLSECVTNYSDKLESINNLNADQAGMYRYQGSYIDVNNNYICFGTSDKDLCLQNQDKYMYRIIGITEDGKLELIKKTALTRNGVSWNSVVRSEWKHKQNVTEENKNEKEIDADIPWSESDLFNKLNGKSDKNDNLFIGNNTYDYMNKDSDWYNKIADTEWLSGQLYWSNTYFDLSKIYNIESGKEDAPHYEEASPYYYNGGTESVSEDVTYTTRRQQDSVTCKRYDNTNIKKVVCYKEITNQKFDDKVNAKIGLMHVYDYDYAVQQNGLNCFYGNVYNKQEQQTCKNSWIHMSHNDTTVNGNGEYDWTMSRIGFSPNYDLFSAWSVISTGGVGDYWVGDGLSARPVFYLINTISIKSGNGSINNPYMIE